MTVLLPVMVPLAMVLQHLIGVSVLIQILGLVVIQLWDLTLILIQGLDLILVLGVLVVGLVAHALVRAASALVPTLGGTTTDKAFTRV